MENLGKPEVKKVVIRLTSHSDFVIIADEIVEKINETRVRETDQLGFVPITSKNCKPYRATIYNCLVEITNLEGFHIATSISSKTPSRYTAENSLISSMALVFLVAYTHFSCCSMHKVSIWYTFHMYKFFKYLYFYIHATKLIRIIAAILCCIYYVRVNRIPFRVLSMDKWK